MTHYFGKYLRNAAILSSLVVPLACTSCKKDNNVPEASLSVSPLSGDVPLEVRIQLSGKDLDGPLDITSYRLNIGGKDTSSSTPFDFKKTFRVPGTVAIYGEVVDSHDARDRTDAVSVNVTSGPYIDQVVKLVNDVNIDYTAILSKISSADLTVTKGGILVFSDKVTDVNSTGNDYAKVLTYANGITKGDYEILLKSNSLEKKNLLTVPNYLPTMNLSGINSNLTEYSFIDLTLSSPVDKNPEDNNGTIISAKSLDGKTKLTLNGNILNVRALGVLGSYQAEIEYGSTIGGISKSILSGSILSDPRPKVNPFIQPNDSTLNWYGSGDLNLDKKVDAADRQLLMDIINGVYSNPSDIRLMDRADVNGDGVVNVLDFNLLNNKLTGVIGYLPGYWNLLMTRGERLDWLGKMMAIDHTELLLADKTVNCVQFSNQLMINFRGFSNADLSKFLNIYHYDVTTNGRFNIPMCEVILGYYDSNDKVIGGHAMNTVVVGDDAFNWNDLCNIEPQFDAINLQPGDYYLKGVNTLFGARGPPIALSSGIIDMTDYFAFSIKNNVPSFYIYDYPVKVINSRGK